ncbi:hypothetical protein SCHPADRAFT_801183, partial [Schizopora paradoxa]
PRPTQGGCRITWRYLSGLSESECLYRFRFTAQEIRKLVRVMQLPEGFKTSSGYVFDRLEAFCLLCARLRSAGDMYELVKDYGCQASISEIVNEVVEFLDDRWKYLFDFDVNGALNREALARYADAIFRKGAPVRTVWGFIDCTIRRICRPKLHQRQAYNGHKKIHAVKFQCVV